MARKDRGPMEEATTIILPNGHSIKLTLNDLSLYS